MSKRNATGLGRVIFGAAVWGACAGFVLLAGCEATGQAGNATDPKAVVATTSSETHAKFSSVPKSSASDHDSPVVTVVTAAASIEEVEKWIGVPIELAPYRRALPAAEAGGRVTAVNFEVGDAVKDGAVLVQVDDSIARLEVTRDEAALERGKVFAEECSVILGKAERDVSRMEALAEGGQASEAELDAARVAVANARSQVAQARNEILALESTLRASRRALDRMAVKAPFAGIVVEKKIEMGGWADTGSAVAEIIDVATLEAMIRIPESLVYVVKANETKARVRVPFAGVEVETPILRLVRGISGSDRGFNAWMRLENKDGRLVPGMGAICHLPSDERMKALTVPIEAVSPGVGGEADRVCVLIEGFAMWVPMKHWYSTDGKAVLIDHVVQAGMRVVVRGAENIPQDTTGVRVEEAPINAPAATDGSQPKLDSRKPE